MTVFFSTEIKSNSLLEDLGNFCFSPIRCLSKGKTYYKVDSVFLQRESKKKTHTLLKIIKVFLSIIFIIPGFVLGTFFKSLSHLYGSVRRTTNNFNKASASRILLEGDKSLIRLKGDPKDLNPSVSSFKKGLPYNWIQANIPSPFKMNLSKLRPHVIERLFKIAQFYELRELDISNTELVDKQITLIIERCPNLRVLKADGLKIGQAALNFIFTTCQTLDNDSKMRLSKT